MICEVGMFQEGHSRAHIPTLLSICLDVELTGKGKLRSKRSQWYAVFDSTYTKIYSLVAQTVKSLPILQETQVLSWVRKIPWRRKEQPIPVFLPGESHGQRSLVCHSPWGHKESDTTE